MTLFRAVLLFLLAGIAIAAILVFAGVLPGFRQIRGGAGGEAVVIWGALPDSSALKEFWSKFNNENKVNAVYSEKDPATFADDLNDALAAGRGPDLVIFPHDLLSREADKFLPLPLVARDFRDQFIRQAEIFRLDDQQVIALPLYVDPLVLYWNRTLFNNAGLAQVPGFWNDFRLTEPDRNLVKLLTLADQRRNLTQSALALGRWNNLSHPAEILSALMMQAGNPIVRVESGRRLVLLKESFGFPFLPAGTALDFFTQFADPTKSSYTWNSALPVDVEVFTGGALAMYLGLASELKPLEARNPHLDFDVTVLPQRDNANRLTFGRLYGLAVTRGSRQPSAAGQVAWLLAGPKTAKTLSETIFLPPARRDLLGAGHTDPFMSVFYQSALISQGWLDPNPTQSQAIFRDLVENITSGRLATMEAVLRANDALQRLF